MKIYRHNTKTSGKKRKRTEWGETNDFVGVETKIQIKIENTTLNKKTNRKYEFKTRGRGGCRFCAAGLEILGGV